MAVILSADDLLSAASELLKPAEASRLSTAIVAAVEDLADALSAVEGVTLREVSFQPDAGGLCATFRAGAGGQNSERLGAYDRGGEW
ncbi:MAG: hypothetical protein Q8R98_25760 [Rubrivivax sp.]|nr:hypothetical protein [Rubrivivax sp.]